MLSISDSIAEWGYDREDFDGPITVLDIVASEDQSLMEAVARRALISGHGSCAWLYHLEAKSGESRWVFDRTVIDAPRVRGCIVDVHDLMTGGAWPFSEPTAWMEDGRVVTPDNILLLNP